MSNAVINTAASGDTPIIAAPGAGNLIWVMGYNMVAASAVTATWKNGSTALTGAMTMATGSAITPHAQSEPLFALSENTALVLTLSGAVQVSGHVTYVIRRIQSTTS